MNLALLKGLFIERYAAIEYILFLVMALLAGRGWRLRPPQVPAAAGRRCCRPRPVLRRWCHARARTSQHISVLMHGHTTHSYSLILSYAHAQANSLRQIHS